MQGHHHSNGQLVNIVISLIIQQEKCYDDRLDEFEDSAMVEDIESTEYGIEWEYIVNLKVILKVNLKVYISLMNNMVLNGNIIVMNNHIYLNLHVIHLHIIHQKYKYLYYYIETECS